MRFSNLRCRSRSPQCWRANCADHCSKSGSGPHSVFGLSGWETCYVSLIWPQLGSTKSPQKASGYWDGIVSFRVFHGLSGSTLRPLCACTLCVRHYLTQEEVGRRRVHSACFGGWGEPLICSLGPWPEPLVYRPKLFIWATKFKRNSLMYSSSCVCISGSKTYCREVARPLECHLKECGTIELSKKMSSRGAGSQVANYWGNAQEKSRKRKKKEELLCT